MYRHRLLVRLCALLAGLTLAALPAWAQVQAPAGPAAPAASAPAGGAGADAGRSSKRACNVLDQSDAGTGNTAANDKTAQDYFKEIYDNAQLPQPYHGVLSSNVLPAEGLSSLTFDRRLDQIESSCVVAFLVDDPWGLKGLRQLKFRSVNVEIFKQTAGTDVTRIFFVIPDDENPKGWALYKPAFLTIGAFKKSNDALVFSFSTRVSISSRSGSRLGGILFAVAAYLLAALAAWRRAGGKGSEAFTLNPVRITAGVLGDGSISQLQVFGFTLMIGSLMFFLWLWTGLLSNISQDLLVLMGISSAGAVGAKYTATLKSQLSDESARFLHTEGWFSGPDISTAAGAPSFGDLLLTNNRLDVYKFQMAIFSVLVAVYILGNGSTDLGEVKISETLLYLIGISHGVYVGGKAVSDTQSALNDRVKSLIALKARYAAAATQADRDQTAADYLRTATAARPDFQALMNVQVPDAKLRLT